MAAAISKAELQLAYQEFWPMGMAFPPTMPWLGTTGTRSAFFSRLEGRRRRGELEVPGDPGAIASAMAGAATVEFMIVLAVVSGAVLVAVAASESGGSVTKDPNDESAGTEGDGGDGGDGGDDGGDSSRGGGSEV